jgi:hypothetical protein
MASFTLPNTPFPEGTVVSAYDAEGYASFPAVPPGSPAATATVTGGVLTFSGLANHGVYFAAANVGGVWQNRRFSVGENGPPPSLDQIDYANVAAGYALVPNADESGFEFFNIGMSKARPMPTEDADRDTENLQESFGNESPNEVLLGAGDYRPADTLVTQGRKKISGAGQGVSTITLEDHSDCDLITTAGYGAESVPDLEISGLTLNGNRANNAAGSGIVSDGQRMHLRRLVVAHFVTDAINHKMSEEGDIAEGGVDSTMDYVIAGDVGRYGIYCNAHDTSQRNCQAIQCTDTGFYWAANGYAHTCHAFNLNSASGTATKTGFNFAAADVHCVDCTAEGSTLRQVLIAANSIQWWGGELFNSADAPDANLFEINGGTSPLLAYANCHDFGAGGAINFITPGQGAMIFLRDFKNGAEAVVGSPHDEISWDTTLGGTTLIGTGAHFKRKQYTFQKSPPGVTVPVRTLVVQEENGRLQFLDAGDVWRDFQMNAKETVASAATISFSTRASLMELTGTAQVKKINPTYAGHRIVVWFTSTAKLLDEAAEGNLKLKENLEGAGPRMVPLVCDGTNWRQEAPMVAL